MHGHPKLHVLEDGKEPSNLEIVIPSAQDDAGNTYNAATSNTPHPSSVLCGSNSGSLPTHNLIPLLPAENGDRSFLKPQMVPEARISHLSDSYHTRHLPTPGSSSDSGFHPSTMRDSYFDPATHPLDDEAGASSNTAVGRSKRRAVSFSESEDGQLALECKRLELIPLPDVPSPAEINAVLQRADIPPVDKPGCPVEQAAVGADDAVVPIPVPCDAPHRHSPIDFVSDLDPPTEQSDPGVTSRTERTGSSALAGDAASSSTLPASGVPGLHIPADPDNTASSLGRAPVRTRVPLQDPPAKGWPSHILSPELADQNCRALGVEGVLGLLNEALSGKLGIEILMSDLAVEQLLRRLLKEEEYDFGSLYARVRGVLNWTETGDGWPLTSVEPGEIPSYDVNKRYSQLTECSDRIYEARKAAVGPDFIDGWGRSLPWGHSWPRRLWDLHADRVVPCHFAFRWDCDNQEFNGWERYDAVSHSWTSTMSGASTPVNGYEWPVPLPDGVSLEAVRNELLNLGAEYVWLDVVCLRQQGGTSEDLRAEEWAVDIPTIGNIYKKAWYIIRYYNGLGVAFQRHGWSDERHWLRRVWTIQEICRGSIIAGLPEGLTADVLPDVIDDTGKSFQSYLEPVEELEKMVIHYASDFLKLAKELRSRYATKEIDKVAAFGALLWLDHIPLYKADMNLEEAWDRLLPCMSEDSLKSLFWGSRRPGTGRYKWRPSWHQLMHEMAEEDQSNFYLGDCENIEILNNGFVSCPSHLLKGEAQLTWECGDDQQVTGRVRYSDAVVKHLEFCIPGGSRQEHWSDETVRLLTIPSRACVMICKEARTQTDQTAYEKIYVVDTRDIRALCKKAKWEKIDAIFV